MFEFLPKGTSLFGETKTWRKNEKKESEKDDLKSNATIRIGQNKEEEEEKREEMNVNEESTVFLRKDFHFLLRRSTSLASERVAKRIRPLAKRSRTF